MKFYLSSYKLGNRTEELQALIPKGKIGYIPNALDFSGADPKRRETHIKRDVDSLTQLGIKVEPVDLREYFGKQSLLESKIEELGAIFISGGNSFVLRQAIKLSGLDVILSKFSENNNFLYAGYSAALAVLAPDLKPYEIVDKPEAPYEEQKDIILEGLGIFDFAFMPHWDSDHPESADIGKAVVYCQKNNIPYKTVRDGEVIIIE